MKNIFLGCIILLLAASSLLAEPKEYNGTLSGRTVSGMLDWTDEKNVSGVLIPSEAPDRKLSLVGRNSSTGKLTLTLAEGTSPVGTVTLTKVTSAASIIWSGTVKFSDGNTGVLELQRAR